MVGLKKSKPGSPDTVHVSHRVQKQSWVRYQSECFTKRVHGRKILHGNYEFSRLKRINGQCFPITKLPFSRQLLLLAAAAAVDIRANHAAWAHLLPNHRSAKVKYL